MSKECCRVFVGLLELHVCVYGLCYGFFVVIKGVLSLVLESVIFYSLNKGITFYAPIVLYIHHPSCGDIAFDGRPVLVGFARL